MKAVDTEAIVLRTAAYSEADRLVTYLIPAVGKLVGIARNARSSRKRFGHCLEPCSRVTLTYKPGTGLAWLERSQLLDAHLALREDLPRWSYAALITEILAEMTPEGDAQEPLYLLTRSTLEQLASDPDPLNVVILFLVRFMRTMGHLPDFQQCRVCRAPLAGQGQWIWQLPEGRLLCPAHRANGSSPLELDLGTLLLLNQAAQLPLTRLWRLRVRKDRRQALRRALLEWVMAQTHRPLKTLKVVAQFERLPQPDPPGIG